MSSSDTNSPQTHSVTELIERLKAGDHDAAEGIWHRYFERLLPLAQAKLKTLPDRAFDEEDALISVFDRFFRAVQEERFPRLSDRNDLWQILLMLTERKVADLFRRAKTQKRGDGRAAITGVMDGMADATSEKHLDSQPSPEFVASFVETLQLALARLPNEMVQEVAILRMEGYTNREISKRQGVSLSTAERKVRLIRDLWQEFFCDD